jgi:hypothetical protein
MLTKRRIRVCVVGILLTVDVSLGAQAWIEENEVMEMCANRRKRAVACIFEMKLKDLYVRVAVMRRYSSKAICRLSAHFYS